jgi:hypothetical protein
MVLKCGDRTATLPGYARCSFPRAKVFWIALVAAGAISMSNAQGRM